MKVYARERYFIRLDTLKPKTIKAIKQHYTHHFFEERGCAKCEWKHIRDRQGIMGECEACAAYKGSTILASNVVIKDKKYLATPLGDGKNLYKLLRQQTQDITLVSKHRIHKIKPITFIGQLRDYQQQAVDACIQGKKGVLFSPPRTGKTVMLSALICKLQVKSLLIASQREWLLGFQETFIGSDTQKPLTDIDKSRIGFCKTVADFDKYDICLATVQTFHSESGQKLLRKIRDKFTLVGIDEVHTSSAYRYIQEVSRFNCKYKIGLTGTPDRKDGKYVLTEQVVGPVLYQVKVESWRPMVKLTRTKYNKVMKSGVWAYMVGNLENDKSRQKLIAECAIKDMKAGHMVLIPYTRVKSIQKQIEVINDMYGSTVAYPFYGGLKKDVRDDTIQKAREYKIKILVGNMRLLSTGTNIPRASALYEVTMSSNLPQATQRFARILTPYEGKPQPIIRYFLDDTKVRKSCMSNEFWNCLMKKFRPIIADKDMEILKSYFSQRSSNKNDFMVDM